MSSQSDDGKLEQDWRSAVHDMPTKFQAVVDICNQHNFTDEFYDQRVNSSVQAAQKLLDIVGEWEKLPKPHSLKVGSHNLTFAQTHAKNMHQAAVNLRKM